MKFKNTIFLMLMFWLVGGFSAYLWDARMGDQVAFMKEKLQISDRLGEVQSYSDAVEDWYTYMPVPERDYQSPMNADDFRGYTSPFGIRLDPTRDNIGGMSQKNHTGQDMVGETLAGTPDALVESIGVGVVDIKYYSKGWHRVSGKMKYFEGHSIFDGYVVIIHPNGDESEYGHLDEIYVYEGEQIDTGDPIGRVSRKLNGKTTGPHLHFSLKDRDGNYLSPFRYVNMPREVL